MNDLREEFTASEYLKKIIEDKLKIFQELTRWSKKDIDEYNILLDKLKTPFDKNTETTKSKGDRLENLISFIISKTYFFEIYRNIHTGTNEIDQVIVLSQRGQQAIETYGFSQELLNITQNIFISECKNYDKTLNVTYVGKFYSLMVANDIDFGILFTCKGLTGDESEYHDGYGLIKVLRLTEKYKNKKDFYILTFTMEDYKRILEGENFFNLIKAKKNSLRIATSYQNFLDSNRHANINEVSKVIKEIRR